jgi:NRPS condensation-like uncharacterized protein
LPTRAWLTNHVWRIDGESNTNTGRVTQMTQASEAPASLGQRLLWFMDHYRGGDGALNCPIVFRLRGPLNIEALQQALAAITARHASLRTTFNGRGRTLSQIVHAPGPVSLFHADLSGTVDAERAWHEHMRAELQTRIDPAVNPLRTTLWKLGTDDHILCVNLHHLVTDGQSYGIFVRELQQLYHRAVGIPQEFPEVEWQHADFARWENAQLKTVEFQRHLAYWQKQLRDAQTPSLPFIRRTPDMPPRQRETRAGELTGETVERLRQLARARRATIFSVMLSIFYVLLHRITGDRDISVSSVFVNRHLPQVQNTMGFFANLLVLRAQIPSSACFSDVLRSCHAMVTDAFVHQSVSYYMLPPHLLRETEVRFDEIVFQMTQPLYRSGMGPLRVDILTTEGIGNRFDFELTVITNESTLTPVVSFNSSRVPRDWAHAFLAKYLHFASHLSLHPDARIRDLDASFAPPAALSHGAT